MFLEKKEYQKLTVYWLSSLLLMLFIIILVGGLTRLTDSGLSITKWEIISGIFPPFNLQDWNKAFDLYKEIPQYHLINKSITLDEFKTIYYWEYFHRILGRIFALIFLIPFLYFLFKKIFSKEFNFKLLLLFILILLQGFIGWYMVKSGLVNNTTVSHFRLAVHLNIAFILFVSIFWYFLNIIKSNKKYFFNFSKENFFIKLFVILLFLQITLGAFTSGLDAGQIYQTWPSMNNNFFPDDYELKNIFSVDIFSEPSVVQFLHRNMAYILLIYLFGISVYVLFNKKKHLYKSLSFVLMMIFIQILLGIFTLLSGLNMIFASLHQISTTILLISSIILSYNSSRKIVL
tara:strand:- start:962 stop:1999 length:1038 start_codon:yes stop_codon:yes gene_type:complete